MHTYIKLIELSQAKYRAFWASKKESIIAGKAQKKIHDFIMIPKQRKQEKETIHLPPLEMIIILSPYSGNCRREN